MDQSCLASFMTSERLYSLQFVSSFLHCSISFGARLDQISEKWRDLPEPNSGRTVIIINIIMISLLVLCVVRWGELKTSSSTAFSSIRKCCSSGGDPANSRNVPSSSKWPQCGPAPLHTSTNQHQPLVDVLLCHIVKVCVVIGQSGGLV